MEGKRTLAERAAWAGFAVGAGAYLILNAVAHALDLKLLPPALNLPLLAFGGMLDWLFFPKGTPRAVWLAVGVVFYGQLAAGIAWVAARQIKHT